MDDCYGAAQALSQMSFRAQRAIGTISDSLQIPHPCGVRNDVVKRTVIPSEARRAQRGIGTISDSLQIPQNDMVKKLIPRTHNNRGKTKFHRCPFPLLVIVTVKTSTSMHTSAK